MPLLLNQISLCCFSLLYLAGLILIICLFHEDEIPAHTSSQVITVINYCLLLMISTAGFCFLLINMFKDYWELPRLIEFLRKFCHHLVNIRLLCVTIMIGVLNFIDTCTVSSCYPNRPMYFYAITPPHLAIVWLLIRACLPSLCLNLSEDQQYSLNGINPLDFPDQVQREGELPPVIARRLEPIGLILPIDPNYFDLKQSHQRPLATECCICATAFLDQDQIMILKCGHFNHVGCLKKWFITHLNCPMCRELAFIKAN